LNPSRSDDSVPVETVLFTSKRVDQKGKEKAVRAVDSIENIRLRAPRRMIVWHNARR